MSSLRYEGYTEMEIFRVLESCTVNEIIDFIYKNKEEAKGRSKSGRTALHELFYPDKTSKFMRLFARDEGIAYEDLFLYHYEADKCLTPIVNALLDIGVDPNEQNDDGETALHELCSNIDNFNDDFFSIVLSVAQEKLSAMHALIEQEKLNAMRALIAGGADQKIKNKYRQTAYDCLPSDKNYQNCPSFILGNCKKLYDKKETAR